MSPQSPFQRWCSVVLLAVLAGLALFYLPGAITYHASRYWLESREREPEQPVLVEQASIHEQLSAVASQATHDIRPAVVRVETHVAPQREKLTSVASNPQREVPSWRCGLIIDPNGSVVTSHVRESERKGVRVYLAGTGHACSARVVGSDETTGLALLMIDPPVPRLAHCGLSALAEARAGDAVIAIGDAWRHRPALWIGVVTHAGRLPTAAECCARNCMVVTSANPSNVGGPLVNLHGQLLGITVVDGEELGRISPRVVAAATVREVVAALAKDGRVRRGWMGLFCHAVETGDANDRPGTAALEVDYVVPGSAADRAGLQAGDVLVSLNGAVFASTAEFRSNLVGLPTGESVTVAVVRDGQIVATNVEITERPEPPPLLPGEQEWGVWFRCGPPVDVPQSSHSRDLRGVQVAGVTQAGIWHGLSAGDVICALDGAETPTVDALCRALLRHRAQRSGRPIELTVISQGRPRLVMLEESIETTIDAP